MKPSQKTCLIPYKEPRGSGLKNGASPLFDPNGVRTCVAYICSCALYASDIFMLSVYIRISSSFVGLCQRKGIFYFNKVKFARHHL